MFVSPIFIYKFKYANCIQTKTHNLIYFHHSIFPYKQIYVTFFFTFPPLHMIVGVSIWSRHIHYLFYLLFFICSCASCHSSCSTCNGSSETQCITCRSGRFSIEGKCLNNCPNGYYGDKKRQECMPCPTGCETCTTNGFCLTCKENWNKNKKNRCILNGSDNCDECKCFDFVQFQFLVQSVLASYFNLSSIYRMTIFNPPTLPSSTASCSLL